jgi:hypothetical protein
MPWLFLVLLVLHPAARRVCLQAALHVYPQAALHSAVHRGCLQAAVHPCGRVGLHAREDSTAHRRPGAGSAVGAAGPDRAPLRTPRISPGQAPTGLEAWLPTASLRAAGLRTAGPDRAPPRAARTLSSQALAGREAWLQTASLRAAGPDRNSHRKFNPFLRGADRFYRPLRAARL